MPDYSRRTPERERKAPSCALGEGALPPLAPGGEGPGVRGRFLQGLPPLPQRGKGELADKEAAGQDRVEGEKGVEQGRRRGVGRQAEQAHLRAEIGRASCRE